MAPWLCQFLQDKWASTGSAGRCPDVIAWNLFIYKLILKMSIASFRLLSNIVRSMMLYPLYDKPFYFIHLNYYMFKLIKKQDIYIVVFIYASKQLTSRIHKHDRRARSEGRNAHRCWRDRLEGT